MPSHMDANATDAVTALAAIWAQMRFVRLAVLVFSGGAPLTDWLRGPDGVTCALRVSALAAGTAVVHRSSVAGGSVRDSHDHPRSRMGVPSL